MLRTFAFTAVLLASSAQAETDAEMIKRVGLDPRAFSQGQLDPGKLPGLTLWLRADTGVTVDARGRVTAWADQSGHSNDLVQANTNLQPLLVRQAVNHRDAVRFNDDRGAWACLERQRFARGSQSSMSVFLVAKVHKNSFAATIFSYGNSNGKNTFNVRVTPRLSAGVSGGPQAVGTAPVIGRGFRVFGAVVDQAGGAVRVYDNGAVAGQATGPVELVPEDILAIGARSWDHMVGVNADVAEALVYDRALSEVERQAVERFLTARYELAGRYLTPLANQLPFAYYPSSSELEVAFDKDSPMLKEYFAAEPRPAATPPGTEPGVSYAHYTNSLTPPGPVPDFAKLTPAKTGVMATLSLAPAADGTTLTGDHTAPLGVIYKGYLDVPQTGVYTFYLRQYNIAQFFVGDRLVVDMPTTQWGPQFTKQRGGAIALAAGKHPITLAAKVFARLPEATPELVTWSGPGLALAPIPAARLSHGGSADWTVPTPAAQAPASLPAAVEALKEVGVRVVALKDGSTVKTFTLPLDGGGRGQARFKLPELPDGEYAVEWLVPCAMEPAVPAGARNGNTGRDGRLQGDSSSVTVIRATQTFTRRHFAFEKNELGLEHKVYPPFTPVAVKGRTVSVVDRTYTVNAQGLFDSVVSKGKELLAEPMKLVAEDATGKTIEWQGGSLFSSGVKGQAVYPDLAQFACSAQSSIFNLQSSISIEEDGCARVALTLNPSTVHRPPSTISRLYLELRFRDQDVPLFHYTGNDSMRHNYAGKTPRGGKIVWDLSQGWVPCDWKAEPGPSDGIIWDSTQIKHWSPGNRDNFCPYIWLGAEERGLAWFAGTDHGYINDGRQPVQVLSREGDQVVLRVYFIQQPTTLDKPLRCTFGLQASPTKPLRADWRTHQVPGGGGVSVHVWGGYICSDKYPDGADFTIVDKLMEARKTGKVDEAWFNAKDKNRAWSDMKVHFESPWLADVGNTAGHLANQVNYGDGKSGTATYFEEHAQFTRYPEWQVFQDEWSAFEFNRFQATDGNWSQAARSYRDFALYYANEWMKRGVSMYFDNTMHRVVDNPYNQDFIGRTITIWEQRDYYKRIWKVLTRLNLTGGTPYELDFTGHITNTQTIPQNTWMTATLDLEQPYRIDTNRPARTVAAGDASWMSAGKCYRLPFPPDYTRAMSISRAIGCIPHIMYPLPNWGDYRDPAVMKSLTEGNWNTDAGMQLVHEIARPSRAPGWGDSEGRGYRGLRLGDYLAWFGYGSTALTTGGQSSVVVHNYWEEKPFVTVSDPLVTWLALERPVSEKKPVGTAGSMETAIPAGGSFPGLLLLQSYKEEPVTVSVRYPGGGAMMDFFTREVFAADAQGAVKIPVAGVYGTRLLAVAGTRAELPAIPVAGDILVDDFELGLSPALKLPRGNLRVVEDAATPGNHVLRIPPGHPGVHQLVLQNPEAIPAGDATLSFKFRLPVPPQKTGRAGVLAITYRSTSFYPNGQGYDLRLACDRAADGKLSWFMDKVAATRNNKPEPFTNIGIDLTGNTIPGIPVDTQWHRLTMKVKGARQTIRLDDTVVFEGDSDASLDNRFTLAPGWGWEASIPYVEIDDLRLQK